MGAVPQETKIQGILRDSISKSTGSGLIDQKLTLQAFQSLSGILSGYPFVKVVVDVSKKSIHFINHSAYQFHVDYIAEQMIGVPRADIHKNIDEFNRKVYLSDDRDLFLGILTLHESSPGKDKKFFTLETVEIDNMSVEMIQIFHRFTREFVDSAIPLFFKPANQQQENSVRGVDRVVLPRVMNHEIYSSADYVALHPGVAQGRLRIFQSEEEFREVLSSVEWFDIVAMPRVPDFVPRVAGLINSEHTTPLSHTNVLASGWKIPNAVQRGVLDDWIRQGFNRKWVELRVDVQADRVELRLIDTPGELPKKPSWAIQKVNLESPETEHIPIRSLVELRHRDRIKYGTKAANIGELEFVLNQGSKRLLGFYRIPRPPRANLLPYVESFLKDCGIVISGDWDQAVHRMLRDTLVIPRGIAVPFAVQEAFLASSPRIQQQIGKLKMALELGAHEIDPICLRLQQMIRETRIPDSIRDYIDAEMATHLSGVSSFVVRSSSNAEDLKNFSAAGIYESINHVSSAETILTSLKEVWASLVSPRSVRLRADVGISLDDSYMGVIIQEEVQADMGGVLVTTNPMNRAGDFRNVYINVLPKVTDVVAGSRRPYQYLYNTVEGGGRTLSLGDANEDLSPSRLQLLQRLAFVGRFLQSHFSPDYLFSDPVDIEWAARGDRIYLLQLRPYQ